jgi:cytochrome c oxidase cbb3-type subunit 3
VSRHEALIVVLLTAAAVLAAACKPFPGRIAQDAAVAEPDAMTDFNVLYGANCAGCHGPDGKGGAARGLADPIFLQIANEATIRRVTSGGVPGTAMPAFAKTAGGALTDQQIDAIVRGMRIRWAKVEGTSDIHPPPYSTSTVGDPKRGGDAFGMFCSTCHGVDGRGGQGVERASSIVDASYLSLVSDQDLRTTVIVGRPDLGAPDWRGNLPGRPMSSEEVSDVVAWLASKRPHG